MPKCAPWTLLLACLVAIAPAAAGMAAETPAGEQIYRQQCANCHGDKGQGTDDEYPEALAGDRSVAELAALIGKTMPKDKVGACVGTNAEQVAAYIYDAFYSPDAQLRNRPPRVELGHLTVRQYRQSVADLLASFRGGERLPEQRGLKAEYFKSKQFRKEDRVIERVDPVVDFDYGDGSPDKEKIDPKEFVVRWQGAVYTPETGEYEFNVRTDNAIRLWVNDNNKSLIDAWVKSGDDPNQRGTIWLTGGRAYTLRLEYLKGKEPKASVSLRWKRPQQTEAVIPERYLLPQKFPEWFVVRTPFPPDDRSVGYERGSSVSKAWDSATTDAAIEVANYVVGKLDEFAGTRGDDGERNQKIRNFSRKFVERAFRRPLSDEQAALYVDRQFQAEVPSEVAAKRTIMLALKSPRFLYPAVREGEQKDSYDVAAQLALGLWDSLPDPQLNAAAAKGQLSTREQIAEQAQRMARDPRAQAKLHDFFRQWLRVDQVTDLAKDPSKFPEFNTEVASDLRQSLDLFVDDLVSAEQPDYRQLLLADAVYMNGRLAKFYGVDLPENAPFQKVVWEPENRAGVLTHPYLLTGFAYTATSSPIHRGVFIARSLLGRTLRPPPEAVTPLAPDLHADLTTRERVALQTKAENCMGCHSLINPLGFTLENFDAVGRYRKEEQGKQIDASGGYIAKSGQAVDLPGVRALAEYLATSDEAHSALVQQLFQYLVKQPPQAYGPEMLPTLRTSLAEHDFNLRELMVEIMVATALQPH